MGFCETPARFERRVHNREVAGRDEVRVGRGSGRRYPACLQRTIRSSRRRRDERRPTESRAANLTPGDDCTRSRTYAIGGPSLVQPDPYCAVGNATRAVSTRAFKTDRFLLEVDGAADEQRRPGRTIITSAACAAISNCRIHGFSDPPSAPLPSPRSAVSVVRHVACHAGSKPTNIALPMDHHHGGRAAAAVQGCGIERGTPSGASRISTGNVHHAIARPATPPSAASTRLSVST